MATGIFYPSLREISAISLGVQTVVSFLIPHDFTPGQIISFRVSKQYGTVELNNQSVLVQSTTQTTITVNIDSREYNPFIPNPPNPQTLPLIIPSASGIVPGSFPVQTSLIDAFDHIPPG